MQEMANRICQWCEAPFTVPAYKARLGWGKYCSHACMHKGRYPPPEERFWAQVDKQGPDDCWPWTGCLSNGYGLLYVNDKSCRVHRYSYELVHGPIPDGLFACHTCDNPSCCNPAHIFLGTTGDNTRDAARKKRMPYGETHHNAKLTETDVRQIRSEYADGLVSYSVLAARYDVSKQLIYRVIRRKAWKHIP